MEDRHNESGILHTVYIVKAYLKSTQKNMHEERDRRGDAVALSLLFLLLFLQAHCAALDQLRKRLARVSLRDSKSEMRMNQ